MFNDVATRAESARQADSDYSTHAILLTSIDSSDIRSYVQTTCEIDQWEPLIMLDDFSLPADPLIAASGESLCQALAAIEEPFQAVLASGGDDEQEVPAIEVLRQAFGDLSANAPADAQPNTLAYIRSWYLIMENAFVDDSGVELGLGALDALDYPAATSELAAACPDVNDPTGWFIVPTGTVTETTVVTDTTTGVTASGDGDLTSYTSFSVGPATLQIGEVEVMVTQVGFSNIHIAQTGRETDERNLELGLRFSRTPDFAITDISVSAPDGTVFSAEPTQDLLPDFTIVRFPVDREVTSITGWTLTVAEATFEF